jgi:hypothetical protein
LSGRSLRDVAAEVVRVEYRRDVLKAGLRFASIGVQLQSVIVRSAGNRTRPDKEPQQAIG